MSNYEKIHDGTSPAGIRTMVFQTTVGEIKRKTFPPDTSATYTFSISTKHPLMASIKFLPNGSDCLTLTGAGIISTTDMDDLADWISDFTVLQRVYSVVKDIERSVNDENFKV